MPERTEEAYREDVGFFEDLKSLFGDLLEEQPLAAMAESLRKVTLLLSDSDYASLGKSEGPQFVDDAFFQEKTEEFISELSAYADRVNRTCIRAGMARMNGLLPPRFTTEEALETYIFESLRSCTSVPEKLGCVDIIEQLLLEA